MRHDFCTLIIKHASVVIYDWVISQMHTYQTVLYWNLHDTLQANVNGILLGLPHTLRSETPEEMKEVTDIQSEGRLSQRCSNTQRPLSLATASARECHMRLEWKWTTDCPRKKHKDKETREHWHTLRLHYYLQKLCWTFETFSDKCQIFSDHRKQDFFALLK